MEQQRQQADGDGGCHGNHGAVKRPQVQVYVTSPNKKFLVEKMKLLKLLWSNGISVSSSASRDQCLLLNNKAVKLLLVEIRKKIVKNEEKKKEKLLSKLCFFVRKLFFGSR